MFIFKFKNKDQLADRFCYIFFNWSYTEKGLFFSWGTESWAQFYRSCGTVVAIRKKTRVS